MRVGAGMEQAAIDHIQGKIEEEVRTRFPDAPVQRVAILQYGDEPVVEPGELVVRVYLEAEGDKGAREEVLEAFHHAHKDALEEFREKLAAKLPEARKFEVRTTGDDGHGPRIMMARPGPLEARALGGGELTPVMARLGPGDLETLDTLITAGIAPNRAEAVRWALARIRERPAYTQLRDRAREIEELKAQF
jgi:glycosyltransferase involved in cell wall biosynthesis